jgi:polyphosphate glucokinase
MALAKPAGTAGPRTLAIDIGGTGIKMIALDASGRPVSERQRELTPRPATPGAVFAVIRKMIDAHADFERVSVGFPGVVVRGVVRTAPNLDGKAWRGVKLQEKIARHTHKPTRVINDADLQGYGAIEGRGVEVVLTLGTGLGSALYIDGMLVPNLELGHHPFRNGKTYEELVSNRQLKTIGKKRWRKRVAAILEQVDLLFNCDRIHAGGGNASRLKTPLPARVRVFDNVKGMTGGIRLWDLTSPRSTPPPAAES